MSIPRKSLDTSNGRKRTNKLSWCSFFKSLNPCIFARCDNAFYFSNEYTMAPLLRHPRPKAVISLAIHFCTPSLLLKFPLPSTQTWPIVSSQGTEIGETSSFHTAWGPVFSDNCAVSPEGGHLLTLSMWVSHYLLRFLSWICYWVRFRTFWFFSSGLVGARIYFWGGEMVSQALQGPWEIFNQGPGCLAIVSLLPHQQSTHLPIAPHGGWAANYRMLTRFPIIHCPPSNVESEIMQGPG